MKLTDFLIEEFIDGMPHFHVSLPITEIIAGSCEDEWCRVYSVIRENSNGELSFQGVPLRYDTSKGYIDSRTELEPPITGITWIKKKRGFGWKSEPILLYT